MKRYDEMSDSELLRELHKQQARKRAYTRYGFGDGDGSQQDHMIQQIIDEADMRGIFAETALGWYAAAKEAPAG